MNVNALVTKGLTFCRAKSPVITAVVTTIGFGVAMYMVAKKSPKVPILLQNAQQKKGEEPLTKVEKGLVYAKAYAVPGMIFATCTVLNIWSAKAVTKKVADIEKSLMTSTALYSAAQAKLANYEAKVEQKIGTEAKKAIDQEITQERKATLESEEAKAKTDDLMAATPSGKLCYFTESNTGVTIYASYSEVIRNVGKLNKINKDEGSCAIAEFLDMFDKKVRTWYPQSANELAWFKDDNVEAEFRVDEDLMAQTGEPAFIIYWSTPPVYADVVNGVS